MCKSMKHGYYRWISMLAWIYKLVHYTDINISMDMHIRRGHGYPRASL